MNTKDLGLHCTGSKKIIFFKCLIHLSMCKEACREKQTHGQKNELVVYQLLDSII